MIVPEYVLVWTILGQATILSLLGGLNLAASVWTKYRERKTESVRKPLQSDMLDRLFSSDPDWASWVSDLDSTERREVETLLDAFLRKIEGEAHGHLRDLADDLGLIERARQGVTTNGQQFRAMTWLALLHEPIAPSRLVDACGDDQKLRDAAARVLLNSDHPDGPEKGTALLVGRGEQPMTVMGMDTLYRLNNGSKTPLVRYLESAPREWPESLLIQALLVFQNCTVDKPLQYPNWLFDLLNHEASQVRLASIGVLQTHGWHPEVRRSIDFEQLTNDPDPNVRRNSYLLLASWQDRESLRWLRNALGREHPVDRLSVVKAFHLHPHADISELPNAYSDAVAWVRAERNMPNRRRIRERSKMWV